MQIQKPLFVIGLIGLFAIITVFVFAQSLWHSAVHSSVTSTRDQISAVELESDALSTLSRQVYRPEIRSTDPIRGNKSAKVDIVEYGDFQCPYCAQVQTTIDEIRKNYNGKVQLIWKDFPNPAHPQARQAALAARCAQEQGKFWEYHDYLFANQGQLDRSTYSQIAQRMGLVMTRFDVCIDDVEKIELIGESIDEAQQMEVDGTPYFLINGRSLPYAGTYQEFEALIEQALGETHGSTGSP